MDIFDLVDCEGCPSCVSVFGERAVCRKGAPGEGPCGEMLDAMRDAILVGRFERFADRVSAVDMYEGFDFSSAPYWYIPEHGEPVPYTDIRGIYNELFS